jgi:signal recognition particle subunit SRP54
MTVLTNKLQDLFDELKKFSRLTPDQVSNVVKKIRLTLLESDVVFGVVKKIILNLKYELEKVTSLDAKHLLESLHRAIIIALGGDAKLDKSKLKIETKQQLKSIFNGDNSRVLLAGLQGTGKTTFVVKLACLIKNHFPEKRLVVGSCDLQRPKAIDQLRFQCEKYDITFLHGKNSTPLDEAKWFRSKINVESSNYFAILDTAGRVDCDVDLINELKNVVEGYAATESIYVLNSTAGQQSLDIANRFKEATNFKHIALTMLDSDAKGGAALSACSIDATISFESHGEKVNDIQLFNIHSMADRILGLGDTLNLTRKLKEYIPEKDAQSMKEKIMTASFTYDDYLKQLNMVEKMGSLSSLLKMVPGFQKIQLPKKQLSEFRAIISSMTRKERLELDRVNQSRMNRIASGSGVRLKVVKQMIDKFKSMKKMFKDNKMLKQMMGKIS